MKNIVIAAGYATRLGELTKNFPKPLLKIGEKSILGRMLDDIDQIPEIDEHIIVTNHKFAPIFEQWVKEQGQCSAKAEGQRDSVKADSQRDSVKGTRSEALDLRPLTFDLRQVDSPSTFDRRWQKPITIIDDGTSTNDTRLGAVCDLLLAIDYLDKKSIPSPPNQGELEGVLEGVLDGVLVVAADNLLFFSFSEFVNFAKEKGTSCIMCHEQPSIEKLQRTGVVELDENNKVLSMEEKPQVPKSHWAVPPFYIYLKKDLDLVRHSVENGCGKDAPGNLAHYMVEHTTMHAWPMSAGRFDIGSLDTYYEAQRLYGQRDSVKGQRDSVKGQRDSVGSLRP
jgi:glucose-1-phosphate thymidylyltransferase